MPWIPLFGELGMVGIYSNLMAIHVPPYFLDLKYYSMSVSACQIRGTCQIMHVGVYGYLERSISRYWCTGSLVNM